MSGRRTSLFMATVFVLLGAVTSLAQQGNRDSSAVSGNYVSGFQFGGSAFTLNGDGTFSERSSSCTFSTTRAGIFAVEGETVRFTVTRYTGNQHIDGKEVDLFDDKIRADFFQSEKYPAEREFNLILVHWDQRIYLVAESEVGRFANAINLGVEPRPVLTGEPYVGEFHLRQGDEAKAVSTKPVLPVDCQKLLLDKPITAKVISLETQNGIRLAIVDKGSRDGLKIGVSLIRQDQEPVTWSNHGSVVSIDESTARIVDRDFQVGDVVSSKYVPKERYR